MIFVVRKYVLRQDVSATNFNSKQVQYKLSAKAGADLKDSQQD